MEYPFPHCLEPRVIRNQSTQDDILVSCGSCVACLNKKSARNQRLCELEEKGTYCYSYFCTLTYYDSEIPLYRLNWVDNNKYTLTDLCDRSLTYGEELFIEEPLYFSDDDFCYLMEKVRLPMENCISYLHYRDIQLFNKLLRKHLKKYTDAKFRFFATGEYGPDTYRAHWHIVYFFDRELPPQIDKEFIFRLWGKGEQGNFDRCKGGAVSYASAYVNSSHSLPSIYADASASVKSRHSIRLGFEYCEKTLFPQISEMVSTDENRGRKMDSLYQVDGHAKHLPFDRTFRNSLFPKPYRFVFTRGDKSFLSIYRAYNYYSQQFADVVCDSVKALCTELFDYLIINRTHYYGQYTEYDYQFMVYIGFPPYSFGNVLADEDLDTFYNRLYRYLLFSRQYCQRMDDNPKYIDKLHRFYSMQEYNMLCQQYVTQEQYFSDGKELDLSAFYDSLFNLEKLKENSLYSAFSTNQSNIHSNKLKKKKINDLSGLLYNKKSQNYVKRNVN